MRRAISLFLIIAALLTSSIAFAQTPRDADGDGIPDSRDRCPVVKGPIENGGCPFDADGDGIADADDSCPTQGGPIDNGGCPITVTDTTAEATPTPQAQRNLLLPPSDGECQAAPILNARVNGRATPEANGAIIAVLEPDVLYPVIGLIALPDEEPFYYLKYKLADAIISSFAPAGQPAAFESGFLGGVFVAASVLNVDGDCGVTPVGLLLPAVQKIRQAAARMNTTTQAVLHIRKSGGDGTPFTEMTITLSDLLISSLTGTSAGGTTAAGNGKVSLQDFHFVIGRVVEGEDGDTLVFDLTNEDPVTEAGFDYLLDLDGIPGESSEESQAAPSSGDTLLYLLRLIAGGEGVDECDAQALRGIIAQGGTVEAIETDYGIEFVVRLPEGVQPDPISPCTADAKHREWILIESLAWRTGKNGAAQATLAKIAPETFVVNGLGVGGDGTICVDMQTNPDEMMCIPSVPAAGE